ncbi:putative ABC transporter peptide-binding protein YtcQ [Paenibacillus montaniterrae]|uniref:ABC transporter peptide-binding protein YtcQ n=1 Tax=Paenibacillus montaniterrae TaxID=429341 RepID=A0A920D0T1_9BACL|nr:extracellular solute-binding protein [Paenibacillus montaniterrae]GIP18264.1 putative ABC transporter peptide-binding protein YtcQ [Paenibacillus montaniterrae]
MKRYKRSCMLNFIRFCVPVMMIAYLCGCAASVGMTTVEETKPTEISIMVPLHFPHSPSDETLDLLQQLTNTRLDISWVPDGIYSDKMNTALTTSSYKKVTFVKYTDYLSVKNAIRTGAFWEIGPYLKDFPNLKHLSEDIFRQTAVDGKIYGLYTERPSSRQGIIVRKDWLENLGLKEPSTIEQLYDVLHAFTYQDPDDNGVDDTIGLTDRNDLIYGAFKTLSSYFGTPNNWELTEQGFIPEFETEAYMNTMNFMKTLYEEKLINVDFPVTSKEMQRELLIRGVAGVYIGAMTDVKRLYEEAKQFNESVEFTVINRIEGPSGYRIWSIPNFNGLYLFSKKAIATEEELLKVLAFFDRTMDADVANLLHFGIEDKHYYVKDGKAILPEELAALRTQEVDALFSLMIADLSNPNVMEVAQQHHLWSYAEQLVEDNNKFIVADPTIGLESATYDERGSELFKIISDATYNYILGAIDEQGFAQQVELWRKNGGNQIIAEYSAAYNQ